MCVYIYIYMHIQQIYIYIYIYICIYIYIYVYVCLAVQILAADGAYLRPDVHLFFFLFDPEGLPYKFLVFAPEVDR